jgi:hypothetical protein
MKTNSKLTKKSFPVILLCYKMDHRILCHIVCDRDSFAKFESLVERLKKAGFKVTSSAEFQTLKMILEPQNPGNGTAELINDNVSILVLFIYTFGSNTPNKFFSDRDSPQDTIDLVDDILLKV